MQSYLPKSLSLKSAEGRRRLESFNIRVEASFIDFGKLIFCTEFQIVTEPIVYKMAGFFQEFGFQEEHW